MSTIYEHNYEGKRPSQAMILKKVKEAIKQGAIDIHLNWGRIGSGLSTSMRGMAGGNGTAMVGLGL